MKVFPQIVYDQVTCRHICFGIELNEDGGKFKQEALDYIDKHQEWRGGERLEYLKREKEIQFVWDMDEKGFRQYMENERNPKYIADNYCGAVFFGEFKLEFITTENGNYHNLFHYGKHGYDFLDDGTPYDEILDMADYFDDPHRRTFEGFARAVELQIIKTFNEVRDDDDFDNLVFDMLEITNPEKWYPGVKHNYMQKITRRA